MEIIVKDGNLDPKIINQILSSKGKYLLTFKKYTETRTTRQNAALHLWFTQLAEALNKDGFDMRSVIKEDVDILWSDYTVKECLWRPVQKIFCGKKSTTQLTTEDINKIYDIINKAIGERTGIYIPFPCIEELIS